MEYETYKKKKFKKGVKKYGKGNWRKMKIEEVVEELKQECVDLDNYINHPNLPIMLRYLRKAIPQHTKIWYNRIKYYEERILKKAKQRP